MQVRRAPSARRNANTQKAEPHSQKIPMLMENQITDLKAQLAQASDRETALIDEKSKLLDLLSAEKEEKRALMPPPDEKKQESKGWLLRLIGAR